MSRTILIVDDSKTERVVLKGYLKAEYDIIEAKSGEEAIATLSAQWRSISAIVMDIVMPGMDGFETMKTIKANPQWRSIPIVITTGLDDEDSREKSIALGADNFVIKPFNRKLLLHMVKNAVQLREMAAMVNEITRDGLTGLLSRDTFFKEAERMILRHEPGHYTLACLDIENFKVINDQYGTDVGDEVLLHIAKVLNGFISGIRGLCGRYMADKFAVLYPTKINGSKELTENFALATTPSCVRRPIRICAGRYLVSDITLPVSVMFDRAAMAGDAVRGRYDTFIGDYNEAMRYELLHEQHVVGDMADALENGEFQPWFQPQYNHATGALVGAEALVRWYRDGSIIAPNSFIPVFEKNGFIYEVDKAIWRQVCAHLRRWLDEGREPLPISVNISRYDLFQPDFMQTICALVDEFELPIELLRLEITESAFAESTNGIIKMVGELIERGFTVEIDDFGSGYSSLNTLKDVPASILKLDMRFFETTENSERGGNIVESVVRMAKWLGMSVIAEGVEDKTQADYLKTIGCYYIQGYYYARPMPLEDYEAEMEQNAKEPKLSHMETLETLDSDLFWDPKSMETLIFNSYAGGACILEVNDNAVELLRINDQYVGEMHGLVPEGAQLKDAGITAFMDNEQMEILQSTFKTARDTGRAASCELRLTDGKQVEYLRYTTRMIARTNERRLYYAVIVNITEPVVAEQKRDEAARQLQVIMGNVNGSVSAFVMDEVGNTTPIFCNEKYYEIYGYTKEQAEKIHLDVMSCIVPEDFPNVLEKLNKLKKDGVPIDVDFRAKKRDGSVIYVRSIASRMSMAGYGDEVIVAVKTDFTEQHTLSDQLSTVIENINGGVSVIHMRGDKPEFLLVNEAFFEITGYTKDQFYAEIKSAFDLIHPEDRKRVEKLFMDSVAEQKRYTMEYRIMRRNGAIRHVMCNTTVMQLFGMAEPVQLAIITDITELRRVQEQSLETSDRLNAVMNTMTSGMTAATVKEHIRFLFANDCFYKMHGIEHEKSASDTLHHAFSMIDESDRRRIIHTVMGLTHVGERADTEYRVKLPDGTTRYIKADITVTNLIGVEAPVQVIIYTDITKERQASEQLRFLNKSASRILAQPDSDKAINDTLTELLEYFAGERTYIFELDDAAQTTRNTYEVCAHGTVSKSEFLQAIPYAAQQFWFDAFEKDGFVAVSDVSSLSEEESAQRELLSSLHIRSIIVAPLWREGKLIGYMGVENPASAVDHISRLIALSDYIAVLLTRRDLIKSIEHGRHTAQQLMDDTPGGFLRMRLFTDKNPIVVSFNEGMCAMLNMSGAELTDSYGDDVFRCLAPEDIRDVARETAEAINSQGQYSIKCRLKKKDCGYIWVQVFGRIFTGENGEQFINAYFSDITEQKNAEQLATELLDKMPTGAALYYYDGKSLKIIHINKQYWALVGREATEYDKTRPFSAIHPEDREMVAHEVEESIRHHRDGKCEFRLQCKDGGYRRFYVTAKSEEQSDGGYLLYASYTPVSEELIPLLDMPEALVSSSERAKADTVRVQLLDNLPFGAALFNFDGERLTAIHFNKQYRRIVNSQWTGPASSLDPVSFIHPEDRQTVVDEIKDAIAHKRNGKCEVRLLYGGDEYRTFRLDANIVSNKDDTYRLFVVYTPLTEQEVSFKALLPLMFEKIMESSTDLAFAKDLGFRYICCSKTFAALVGLDSEKDIVGKTDYDLFPKTVADAFRMDDTLLFTNEEPLVDIQEMLPSKDGAAHYIRTTKHLLRSVAGEVIGIYCTGREITEIRTAYAQLKLLTDSIPGGIATFRCKATNIETLYFNDGVCKLAGYTREEFVALKRSLTGLVIEEDFPILNEQVRRLMSGETNVDFTIRINAKDRQKWINTVARVTERIGDVYTVSTVLTDVTVQQEEKERLRLANEEYRIATLHSNRTICRYDIATQTVSISTDAAERMDLPEKMTGVPYERVKQGKISDDTKDAYIAFFEGIIAGKEESSVVFRELLPSGWRWVMVNATTVLDDQGKPFSAIISYVDVTEQREKEAIYCRWQNSLAERPKNSYTLFRCNLTKKSSYESWEGELLRLSFKDGKLSFDQRTEEFIKQCVYAEDRDRYRAFLLADTMLAEYYRGHRTDYIEFREYLPNGKTRWLKLSVDLMEYPDSPDVQVFLMYENIDSQKREQQSIIERAQTDPLTAILNRATFAQRANRIMSESEPDATHALLMIDIDFFKQVNDVFGHGMGDRTLCGIADILTRSSRRQDLVGRLGGDEFVLFLSDIPNKTTAANKARQLCESIRKDIGANVRISASIGMAVFPEDGEGFETLYDMADKALYRVKDSGKNGYAFTHDDPVPVADSQYPSEGAKPAAATSLKRILVVDDNRIDLEILSTMFRNDFRVERATDGAMALMKLRQYGTAISAVLLDLNMPDMDGFEVLRRMKQDDVIRTIPVIVVSADEQRETALRVIRAGADDLVVKPVDAGILHVRVEAAISRSENERMRAQSSYLSMRKAEVGNYISALERSGAMVVAIEWAENEFTYSPSVNERLAGDYNGKRFWRVLMDDMVADSDTVHKMQSLVQGIANDAEQSEGSMTVTLKTSTGAYSPFEMNVFKEPDDLGLARRIIITLKQPSSHEAEKLSE